jgi:NAD(P)-dependent dehydrogenase (short-subunit alcohol dehydrogenase family)
MKSVVITGASTGIGWATAKLLLDRGFRVFGSVRKQADADRLKGEFGANFVPLSFDVTDEAAVLAPARDFKNSPYFPALEKIRAFMLQLGANGLPPERIAETVLAALTLPRPKVRYSIVPDPVRINMMQALPKRVVDKIIAKRLGLVPPA